MPLNTVSYRIELILYSCWLFFPSVFHSYIDNCLVIIDFVFVFHSYDNILWYLHCNFCCCRPNEWFYNVLLLLSLFLSLSLYLSFSFFLVSSFSQSPNNNIYLSDIFQFFIDQFLHWTYMHWMENTSVIIFRISWLALPYNVCVCACVCVSGIEDDEKTSIGIINR